MAVVSVWTRRRWTGVMSWADLNFVLMTGRSGWGIGGGGSSS
jgi:hypothetical protein